MDTTGNRRGRPRKNPPPSATRASGSESARPSAPKKRGAPFGNKYGVGNRGGRGAPFGNKYAVGHGRPRGTFRGHSPDACTIKINVAITPAQRAKLDAAAKSRAVKYTDLIRSLIDAL